MLDDRQPGDGPPPPLSDRSPPMEPAPAGAAGRHSAAAPSAGRPAPVVTVRGANKRFGATQALADVQVDIRPGEVLALLGQNGAGKSTLIKVLAGVYTLDSGTVEVAGHALGSPEAAGLIAFVHQDLALVPGLSVAENIALGAGYPRRRGLIAWRSAHVRAKQA